MKNTGSVNTGTTYIRWSDRLVCGQLFRSAQSTFYEIYCPASGNIIKRYAANSNVAADLTVTADGIPLQNWESLWYELPTSSVPSTVQANLKVLDLESTFNAPLPNWLFIACKFSDPMFGDTAPSGGRQWSMSPSRPAATR